MATFNPSLPLEGLRGADYNPRRIDEEALAGLRTSLARIGVCKPIIVSGDVIIAGHQRTRSLRALGATTAPGIVLGKVTTEDEIRFNQLHNGTDFDAGDEAANVGPGAEPLAYAMVAPDGITANMRGRMANVRAEICKLIQRYGNWGGCVATMDGRVIHAAQYAVACKAMGLPARVYRVPNEMEEEACELLGRRYGVFSYAHLERKTYVQTFAQMLRLRDTASGKQMASSLYTGRVLPALRPGERLLDFGCGQADYVKLLRRQGRPVFGIEFFYRSGNALDGAAVHRMIDAAAAEIEANGLFDVVLADSVLNSVDSLEAEADVLTVLNAFCKPGGRIYFSGRRAARIDALNTMTKCTDSGRYVEFIDEDGFSALFRNGNWFYQKFHSEEHARSLALKYIGPAASYADASSTAWNVGGLKQIELGADEIEAAISREFDLIWPGGRSVGRAERMLKAWRLARSKQPQTANSGTSCKSAAGRRTRARAAE